MNFPKISVVTPSYNQCNFIEETIKSVLDQDYQNLEYIIIDGESSDSSARIISQYENRLHFWVTEKDDGHAHALNKGFSHATGEIMAWINSDDKYTPWTFKAVAEIFTLFPHVDWIVGFNSWWNGNGAMIHASRGSKNIYDYLIGNYRWIQQESVFWRRSLWEKSGGYIDQDYQFMVDGELWSRFFLHAELYSVDCILGGYRTHLDNRAAHNLEACKAEMERAISVLRNQCSSVILNRSRILKVLKMANKNLIFNPDIFSRLISSMFKDIRYRNIHWREETWVERTMPFNL